ncbi:HISIE histidine biosynthesis bifunctional protein, partial [Prunus dulcis]
SISEYNNAKTCLGWAKIWVGFGIALEPQQQQQQRQQHYASLSLSLKINLTELEEFVIVLDKVGLPPNLAAGVIANASSKFQTGLNWFNQALFKGGYLNQITLCDEISNARYHFLCLISSEDFNLEYLTPISLIPRDNFTRKSSSLVYASTNNLDRDLHLQSKKQILLDITRKYSSGQNDHKRKLKHSILDMQMDETVETVLDSVKWDNRGLAVAIVVRKRQPTASEN